MLQHGKVDINRTEKVSFACPTATKRPPDQTERIKLLDMFGRSKTSTGSRHAYSDFWKGMNM